eukprot:12370411-Prorocentrum_lima.AAC.1
MTSSLVGSEMCIRDRPAPNYVVAKQLGGVQRVVLRRVARAPALCPKPVSYTHLTLPTICSV